MLARKIKEGATIGLIAPSFELTPDHLEKLEASTRFFEARGYRVKVGAHIKDRWFFSAGRPEDRAADLNQMFADPEVDAIICINGGGTSSTILQYIDYDVIRANPKIFMGYSDISVLNQVIYEKTGLVTFNGPLFMDFYNDQDAEAYYEEFRQRFIEGSHELAQDPNAVCIRGGKASGQFYGTNVRCSMNVIGTPYQLDYKDKILAVEAWMIEPYEMAVRFSQLKQMGVFNQVRGMVVGYVYGLQAPEMTKGKALIQMEEVLADISKEYDFPILKYNNFGHEIINAIIPIGAEIEMDADNRTLKILGDFIE